jgi:hypothetical protein
VQDGPNEITNNRIGTSADGTVALDTYGYGVQLWRQAPETMVRDNLISGLSIGVEVLGDDNTLQGNRVGTNADGTAALPNGDGINVEGGDDNLIGGTGEGEGNLISGNGYAGLQLENGDDAPDEEVGPAVGNRVLGNLIGTDYSGDVPLGNGTTLGVPGIVLSWADASMIGGHEPGAGNVIAANGGDGIQLSGDANQIRGNAIGTNLDGDLGLGNGRNGIRVIGGNENNIGDPIGASMNTIAYNGEDGISVEGTATDNTVVRNLIFVNGTSTDDLGIDLAGDGVTDNDRKTATPGRTTSSTTRSSPPPMRPTAPSTGRSRASRPPTIGSSSTAARSAMARAAARGSITSAMSTPQRTAVVSPRAPQRRSRHPPAATTSR